MRLLLAGDTHCSRIQIEYLYRIVKEEKCDLIIQLGDFGYWPRMKQGKLFLATISDLAVRSNIEFWWLDGNHEDHDVIDALYADHDRMHLTRDLEQAYGGIYFLPRGYRFELDDIKFISYGGAFSIDYDDRKLGVDWFAQETVDIDHIKSLSDDPVDVLLTHDAPAGYKLGYNEASILTIRSNENSLGLLYLARKVCPKVCITGHHHARHDYQISTPGGWCQCHILNCNGMGKESWAILDTESLKKEWKSDGLQNAL